MLLDARESPLPRLPWISVAAGRVILAAANTGEYRWAGGAWQQGPSQLDQVSHRRGDHGQVVLRTIPLPRQRGQELEPRPAGPGRCPHRHPQVTAQRPVACC